MLVLLSVVVTLSSCQDIVSSEYADLVSDLPAAELCTPAGSDIDFSSTDAVDHLDHRWKEVDPATKAAYSRGSMASVFLQFGIPIPAQLELEIDPDWPPDKRSGTLDLRLNGMAVGSVPVANRLSHNLFLPDGRVRAGMNELELSLPGATSFTVHRVRLQASEANAAAGGTAATAGECEGAPCILQAPGTMLQYYYPLPDSAAFVVGIPARSDDSGTYEVRLDDGGGDRTIFAAPAGEARRVTIPLPATGDAPARLSLSIQPRGASAGPQTGAESFGWIHPRIIVNRPARATPPPPVPAQASSPPNIVIYVLDAMRADHLQPYGYGREVSPNIERLARQSIVFERAYAHSVWTKPSVASLLTGLLPQEHMAIDDVSPLAPAAATLATLLEKKGYTTIGLQANGNAGADYGFDRDFDLFFDQATVFPPDNKKISLSSRFIHERLLENVDALREPFFLFIQSLDPHFPYEPEGEYRSYVAQHPLEGTPASEMLERLQQLQLRRDEEHERVLSYLIGLYDGGVRHNDSYVGALIELLRNRGVYDRTAIFLTADHGEGFHDHGYEVGHAAFFEHTVRVPLIYKPPGSTAGARSRVPVQHLDIVPTILQLVGSSADGLRGTSLSQLVGWHGRQPARPIHMARFRDRKIERFRHDGRAVISWPWKLVRENLRAPEYRIFDLESDPTEEVNLWRPGDPKAERLLGYLRQEERKLELRPPGRSGAPVEIGDSVREQLRQLGYIP